MSDTPGQASDFNTAVRQESSIQPLPTMDQDAVQTTSPKSELDLQDLCKGHKDDEGQTDGKIHTFLEDSNRSLLDTSKGYEGRCKKVGQYLLGCTIGEGSYGKVRLATHLISKQRVAVKVVAKKTLVQKEAARRHFRREALMMQRVYHPNVIRLYQALETGNSYYLVFELAAGGSLLHVLSGRGVFSEKKSRHYMRQIVSALDHLHRSDIVHRDLKLENILLDEHSNVKLVDFGLSAVGQDSSSVLSTQCGSPLYAAPEIFAGRKYGKPVDIWSLGVCLYALLAGRLPFLPGDGASLLQLYSLLLKGCEVPQYLSQPCKDLLNGMLEVHESRRLILDEIFVHPWLTGPDDQPLKRVPPVPKKLSENAVDLSIVKYICTTFRFSERDVVTSVTDRKLTPAAATYHILHDSIESGRICISYPRENAAGGIGINKETRSAPAAVLKAEICTHTNESTGHIILDNEKIEKRGVQMEDNDRILWESAKDVNSKQTFLDSLSGPCSTNELSDKTDASYPARRTTSESTDSGVGIDLFPEETRLGAIEAPDTPHTKTEFSDRFSYKTFIMDLRQNRQKYKASLRLGGNSSMGGVVCNGNTDGNNHPNYVLLGHSPRNQNAFAEERKKSTEVNGHNDDEDKQLKGLGLPELAASPSGSFSPTFPPIAMSGPASHGPASHSTSSSSPVYSAISGLGQQCVKYNTFINSSGGSFYYSSKPIPGFRHGNRYFLHLDKNNFTSSNMGVTGVPTATVTSDRLSCECFAPKFVSNHNASLGKANIVRGATDFSHRPPPPPPNSNSCTPFSYLSGDKIELKAVGLQRKSIGPTNQPPPSPLRLSTNNSSLHVHQLSVWSKNTNAEKSNYRDSELYKIYSHTDFNNDVNGTENAPRISSTSVQQQRRPVRILASLRDLYGIDPWKRSKSERADLSKAVRREQKNRQVDTQACDLSPTVRNPEYNRNHRSEGSRKRRPSKSNKSQHEDPPSPTRLSVPEREEGNESSSSAVCRSNISTPLASEREDFMMPVTSVTIRTIGRP